MSWFDGIMRECRTANRADVARVHVIGAGVGAVSFSGRRLPHRRGEIGSSAVRLRLPARLVLHQRSVFAAKYSHKLIPSKTVAPYKPFVYLFGWPIYLPNEAKRKCFIPLTSSSSLSSWFTSSCTYHLITLTILIRLSVFRSKLKTQQQFHSVPFDKSFPP